MLETARNQLGFIIPVILVLPFIGLLLSIAFFPLFQPHWWEKNKNKAVLSLVCSIPVVLYMLGVHGTIGGMELLHKVKEYASFIILLGSLFMISSGIYISGSFSGTPIMNTMMLALGAVIANLIGTTGAAVLLIRPLLRANQSRIKKAHIIIFFIFIVCNGGGLLTPLGDPPLFLGFLNGVPFFWTLQLWKHWLFVNGILLLVFHFLDEIIFNKEERERPGSQLEEVLQHEPIGVHGATNFLFLVMIIAIIYASGVGFGNRSLPWPFGWQEVLMVSVSLLSYFSTDKEILRHNNFTLSPIIEVGVLFGGIFITMTPALLILNARGADLPLSRPIHFFWISGLLSSFLDNAPTYLTFSATAAGKFDVPLGGKFLLNFLNNQPETSEILKAISCGSVFMGANTYIGNGPNFMIRAIAENSGVKMPTFFGYMAWSGVILIPLFAVFSLVFF